MDIRGTIAGSCLLIILLCSIVSSASPDEPFSGQTSIQNQILIFSGAIPSGDGNVSIKASSGIMYQIPALTPLGVVQTLAGTDMIGSYRIGDSLLLSRGIFTLDAIDSWEVTGTTGWFVQVNGVGLREYLLPAHEGLNTYPLKMGDTVVFAFGDPTLPVTSATAVIQVQIGDGTAITSSAGQVQPVISQQTPLSPAPLHTPVPVVVPVQPQEPVQTIIPAAIPVQTASPVPPSPPADTITPAMTVNATASPTPIPAPVPEPQVIETIRPIVSEPVLNASEPAPPAPVPTPESTPVPAPTPEPTPEAVVTAESTPAPEPEVTDAPVEPTPTPEPTKDPAAERVIYDGKIPLPSGKVNITANSGIEYEIPANSPLGVLHRLLADGMINTLSITDRGMRKGGILVIDGIQDKFFTGSKTWFAQVNGLILQDYFNPETDGLNIYTLKKDDVLIFYYGDPAEPVQSAESVLQVRMT